MPDTAVDTFVFLFIHVPPFPEVAASFFGYGKVISTLLGLLFGILVYLKSRVRTFKYIFWTKRFGAVLGGMVLMALVYYLIYSWIDSPNATTMIVMLALYSLVNGLLIMIVALIVLLAPTRLINFITGLFPARNKHE
jgi:hypothetical protein